MSEWGRRAYGDPCRECGFAWDIDPSAARELVRGLPARLTTLLARASGRERHPDFAWSVGSYVAHVGDNLRIWAERLAGVALGGSPAVATYDDNALARARAYDSISLQSGLWTLERSVRDWLEVVAMAPDGLVMVHPERGNLSVDDIVRGNAHDASHHEWDIERTLTRSVP